jgi:hypothetical protein
MIQKYLNDCEEFDGEFSENTLDSEQVQRQLEFFNHERINEFAKSLTNMNFKFQAAAGKVS